MFTEDDYKQYFGQIASTEKAMMGIVRGILFKTEDAQIKEVIGRVANDELRHYSLVRGILDKFFI